MSYSVLTNPLHNTTVISEMLGKGSHVVIGHVVDRAGLARTLLGGVYPDHYLSRVL